MAFSAPTDDCGCLVEPRRRWFLADVLRGWLPRRPAARQRRPRPAPLGPEAAQDSGDCRALQDYKAPARLPAGRARQLHGTAEALRLGVPRP